MPDAPPLPRRSSSSAGGTRRTGQRLCTDPAVRMCRGASLNITIQRPPLSSTAARPGRPGTSPHRCSPSAPAQWCTPCVGPCAPPWPARLCRAGPETWLLRASPSHPRVDAHHPGPLRSVPRAAELAHAPLLGPDLSTTWLPLRPAANATEVCLPTSPVRGLLLTAGCVHLCTCGPSARDPCDPCTQQLAAASPRARDP